GLTRSERYVSMTIASSLTSEVWLLDAAAPAASPRVVLPRRQGVEDSVDHQGGPDGAGRLLILHNDGALNFELAQVPLRDSGGDRPLADPTDFSTVIAHRADTRLLGAGAFEDHVVVYLRRDGLTGLRLRRTDGSEREVASPEPLYQVSPGSNPEYASRQFRLHYASLATPDSVFDADTRTGELTLRKRKPVLPLPDAGPYDPGAFEQRREWGVAAGGTRVPLSPICRKGTPRDGRAPLVVFGYCGYHAAVGPRLPVPRPSLPAPGLRSP